LLGLESYAEGSECRYQTMALASYFSVKEILKQSLTKDSLKPQNKNKVEAVFQLVGTFLYKN
jgi:hypothetical protein